MSPNTLHLLFDNMTISSDGSHCNRTCLSPIDHQETELIIDKK